MRRSHVRKSSHSKHFMIETVENESEGQENAASPARGTRVCGGSLLGGSSRMLPPIWVLAASRVTRSGRARPPQ